MHKKLSFAAALILLATLAGCQPSTTPAPKATAASAPVQAVA